MSWESVGNTIAKSAPILGGLFGPVGAAVGGLVANLFGCGNDSDSIEKAIKQDPNAAMKLAQFEMAHKEQLIRMQLEHQVAVMAEQTKQVQSVNRTMRAELRSESLFKSGWRPTFGYAAALNWIVQTAGMVFLVGYTAVNHPSQLGSVISSISTLAASLNPMWMIALGVLGVSIHERSKDKQTMTGQSQPGGIGGFIDKLRGK